MKKKLLLSFTIATMALTSTVFANETNTTKAEFNPKTKICSAIASITTISDGKPKIDMSKVQKMDSLRAKVSDVVIPDPETFSFGVLSGLCFSLPYVEIAFETELAARGLTINSFDPVSGKIDEKIRNLGAFASFGALFGTIVQKPELIGAFIDKVKEKRFGKNTIGIPEAKDILVEGSYKKELTKDEEKFVDEAVQKYLELLAETPAII